MGGKAEAVVSLVQKKVPLTPAKRGTSIAGAPVRPITTHIPNMGQRGDIYSTKLSQLVIFDVLNDNNIEFYFHRRVSSRAGETSTIFEKCLPACTNYVCT
jgi:hypothetical protein